MLARRRWPRAGRVLGRGGKHGAFGTCQSGGRAPTARPVGPGMSGALRLPVVGAQPATLTFPRGGPGRAFHGISRTGVSP